MMAHVTQQKIWPWAVLYALALSTLAFNFATEKFLAADGVNFFFHVVEYQRFTTWDWHRVYAQYLTQWPLYGAVRLGWTDLGQLKALYACGMALPYLLGFALSLVALRGEPKWPLVFPTLSYVTLNMPGDYCMIAEGNVAACLAWPTLFFALRKSRYEIVDFILITGLLLLQTRLFACALLTGPIFAYLFWKRQDEGKTARHVLVACSLLLSAFGAYAVLYPFDAGNREDFLVSLAAPLRNRQFLGAASFVIPLLVGLHKKSERWVGFGLLAMAVMWLLVPIPFLRNNSAGCRTLFITGLPLLLMAAAPLLRRPTDFTLRHYAATVILVVAAVGVNLSEARPWLEYRASFKSALKTHRGFLPHGRSPLISGRYDYSWTHPLWSYIWSEGEVRCIILNPPGLPFEPFDPRTTRVLERYLVSPSFVPLR